MSPWFVSLPACLTVALLVTWPVPARAQATLSGLYDGLLLDVQGTRVTRASRRRAAIQLRGMLSGGKAAIQTWTPGEDAIVAGQLTVAGGSAGLRLQHDQDGCGMAAGDMTRSDFTLSIGQAGDGWIGVALVQSAELSCIQPRPPTPGGAKYCRL